MLSVIATAHNLIVHENNEPVLKIKCEEILTKINNKNQIKIKISGGMQEKGSYMCVESR